MAGEMTPVIKICGVKETEHALAAAEAGATHIGFNFAASKRYVEPEQARRCIDVVKSAFPQVMTVGLFVDAPMSDILAVSEASGIDHLQLHGPLDPAMIERLPLPVWPVMRTMPGEQVNTIERRFALLQTSGVEALLLDAYHPTLAGGTGLLADWAFAADTARRLPIILAGGLNPGNVGDAIRQVRPLGVDVASGVERDGRKNAELIRAFITSARAAFDHSMNVGASSQDSP
mgnify:CR=1 FL=1